MTDSQDDHMAASNQTSDFIIQKGVFIGAGVNKGNVYVNKSQRNSSDIAEELQGILDNLYQRYSQSNASPLQRETVFQMELQEVSATDPSFIQRLRNALRSGGFELVKVLTNNPFVSVSLETLRGWIETTTN
jgi:hypothetical protein